MTENLLVEWDGYQKNLSRGLGALQQKGEFVDMTLAAEGHYVKVHQMVMSLVSPFIKDLITSAQNPHPIIFLNKVSYQTMQAILEYAYTGEVVIRKEKIREFLEACKDLHIKGLDNMVKEVQKNTAPDKCQSLALNSQRTQPDQIMPFTDDDNDCFSQDDDDDISKLVKTIVEKDTDEGKEHNAPDVMVEQSVQEATEASRLKNASLQYSVSCQGNLQLVLNRYLYTLRHIRKDDSRFWRCANQQKTGCPAFITTRDNKAIERANLHNHTFHDKQILKRIKDSNIYTTTNDVDNAAAAKKRKRIEADLMKKSFENM